MSYRVFIVLVFISYKIGFNIGVSMSTVVHGGGHLLNADDATRACLFIV